MTVIEIPDQQAAALKEKAAAQGLSLEAWLKNLAEESGPVRGSVVEAIRKLRAKIEPDPEGWTTRDYIDHGRR